MAGGTQVWGLAGFLAAGYGAAALGALFTTAAVREWYPTLRKPSFTPPDAVFGPVWTLLYALMAVAAWLVWRGPHGLVALPLYWVQLALNVLWSALFFGRRAPRAGLWCVLLLWAAIAATIAAFARHSHLAAALMLPYLLWVSYAGALNAAIVRLNPDQ
jgi:tryptophan-rich sensory protein